MRSSASTGGHPGLRSYIRQPDQPPLTWADAEAINASPKLALEGGRARPARAQRRAQPAAPAANARLASLAVGEALLIGSAQILAFFAGISRSGVTMVAGLARGLDHEDAARFAF